MQKLVSLKEHLSPSKGRHSLHHRAADCTHETTPAHRLHSQSCCVSSPSLTDFNLLGEAVESAELHRPGSSLTSISPRAKPTQTVTPPIFRKASGALQLRQPAVYRAAPKLAEGVQRLATIDNNYRHLRSKQDR